jgi:tetrahydromethanopterin S-methyltransferase subunit D
MFGAFTLIVGGALRSHGKVFLDHTFREQRAVADSVHSLLSLGFYLTCASLLLWNVGAMPSGGHDFYVLEAAQSVAVRLGVSILVVATFHTTNILVLSILNRNKG